MTTTLVKKAARRKASEFVVRKPRKDITGREFGKLEVRSYYGSKNHSTYWTCLCECGKEVVVRYSHLTNNQISSCGCAVKAGKSHPKWTGHQEMTGTFLSNIRNNAKTRNLEYSVTNEFIWQLFLDQQRRCALSNVEIGFGDQSASLDRIDSNKGYVESNVQWVHKDINRMKSAFSEIYFIEMCRRVVRHSGP